MNKKYQVFVSSTYLDLVEERQAVMQAILTIGHFPVGMELFPATDSAAWDLIKKVIDDCDYYVLIVAGRYGSVDDTTNLSFTEKEYDYSVSVGKPVLCFVHHDVNAISLAKSEPTEEGRSRLNQFLRKVSGTHHFKTWKSAEDLQAKLSVSLLSEFSSNPKTGWVRGDTLASETSLKKIVELQDEIAKLKQKSDRELLPPPGSEKLAQGADLVYLTCYVNVSWSEEYGGHSPYSQHPVTINCEWDTLIYYLLPELVGEASEAELRMAINKHIRALAKMEVRKQNSDARIASECEIYEDDFHTIKVQLLALGVMRTSDRRKALKDTAAYYQLTKYGEFKMLQLRALAKGDENVVSGR